jgi:membrane protein involved in colicin uptake
MTEQQPGRWRDLPAALLRNVWVQLFVALLACLELYTHGALTAFIATEKGIETRAVADNAVLRQKAEAELAQWKSLTETEVAQNAERKQHADAMKARADAHLADAQAAIARETARNAEIKAKAEAEAAKAESDIKAQQVTVERERAAQAQRLNEAQTVNAEYKAAGATVASMVTNHRVHYDTNPAFDDLFGAPSRR